MPSKGGGRKEQTTNPNAIKKDYHIDKEQPKGMTLTPWNHAPAEDTKKTYQTAHNRERTTKNEENTVLGAHAGCTTDRPRVIHGLLIQQVGCISTRKLYNWQVAYVRGLPL